MRAGEPERLAFDSNALIYFVERVPPYFEWLDWLFRRVAMGDRVAVVSIVSLAEVMVKPFRESNRELTGRFNDVLAAPNVQVLDVDRSVALAAARLRAGPKIDLPDALVIGTALASGCDAIVGNDRKCAERVKDIPYIYLEDAVRR